MGRHRHSGGCGNRLQGDRSGRGRGGFERIGSWEAAGFLGGPGPAFEWLERARLQHDEGNPQVRHDWLLRSLRGDPRWKPFLHTLGLPE